MPEVSSFCSKWWLTQRPTITQGAKSESSECSALTGTSRSHLLPARLSHHWERGGGKTLRARSREHPRAAAHMNLQQLQQHTQNLCRPSQPARSPAWSQEVGTNPTHKWGAPGNWKLLGEENWVLFEGAVPGRLTMLPCMVPHPSIWVVQTEFSNLII